MSLYEVLGVDVSAATDQIRRAFRRQALAWHPDKHGGTREAEERSKRINTAYAVLSCPYRRWLYDEFGEATVDFSKAVKATEQLLEAGEVLGAPIPSDIQEELEQREREETVSVSDEDELNDMASDTAGSAEWCGRVRLTLTCRETADLPTDTLFKELRRRLRRSLLQGDVEAIHDSLAASRALFVQRGQEPRRMLLLTIQQTLRFLKRDLLASSPGRGRRGWRPRALRRSFKVIRQALDDCQLPDAADVLLLLRLCARVVCMDA
jgi:hypothetical protein